MTQPVETLMWAGKPCTKLVLFDEQGIKYTFAIPGTVKKAEPNYVALIWDIEMPKKEEK